MEQAKLKLEPIHFEKTISKNITSDEKIEKITSKLISDDFQIMEENDILFQIIKYTKCDKSEDDNVRDKMDELGLGICHHLDFGYSIKRFANMRGYISDSELERLNKVTLDKIREINPKIAQFMEKYGVDKTEWSNEIADEYEYGLGD